VGTVVGIDSARVFTVIREGVEVEVDRSVYFTSDSVALRGIARVAFGYPQPKSIVRIKLTV
jgi:HK97 family phage major capsid protein